MKKFLLFILFIPVMFFFISSVNAASFQVTASTHQVAPNQTFTVQIGGDCIGRVDITVSNGTSSMSNVWVEQGYISVNVTAGSSGTVSVTATPVMGFSDSDANLYEPGPRTVTVNISSPNIPSTPSNPSINHPGTNVPIVSKSGDNNLSSLTVSTGELSPMFDSSNTEYTLNLEANITTLNIDATLADSKASIEGLGQRSVYPGNNMIELIVTAENGDKKVYKIHVYVDDTPQIYLDYQSQKIGIIRNLEGVTVPEGFQKEEYVIDEKIIPIFKKENIYILYGINENNESDFYLYDKENNTIISTFLPIKMDMGNLYVVEGQSKEGMDPITIVIHEKEFTCYQSKNYDPNYCLLDAINSDGKMAEYLYEMSEKTIQLYPSFLSNCPVKQKENGKVIYIVSGLLLLVSSVLVLIIIKQKKGECHEKIK